MQTEALDSSNWLWSCGRWLSAAQGSQGWNERAVPKRTTASTSAVVVSPHWPSCKDNYYNSCIFPLLLPYFQAAIGTVTWAHTLVMTEQTEEIMGQIYCTLYSISEISLMTIFRWEYPLSIQQEIIKSLWSLYLTEIWQQKPKAKHILTSNLNMCEKSA